MSSFAFDLLYEFSRQSLSEASRNFSKKSVVCRDEAARRAGCRTSGEEISQIFIRSFRFNEGAEHYCHFPKPFRAF